MVRRYASIWLVHEEVFVKLVRTPKMEMGDEREEDGGGDEQEDACELADGREKVEEREEKEGDEDNENCKKMEDEREERNFVQRR
ncbi:uncharacterized protein MONOS_17532 [Monocercomonoides exilis]|uniref:uncharacterized protein n=1 Tax=Monocercomonoides exilis TaxID=2049356 RepID=UPI00355A7A6E|nr:hypothetical protein MONOS_17532 [Monocercomonoides exilis]